MKFKTHRFGVYPSVEKDVHNTTHKKACFHVTLYKYRSYLLTNTNVSKNTHGKVKFCFANLHGNLKIKFSDNINHDREREGDGLLDE